MNIIMVYTKVLHNGPEENHTRTTTNLLTTRNCVRILMMLKEMGGVGAGVNYWYLWEKGVSLIFFFYTWEFGTCSTENVI